MKRRPRGIANNNPGNIRISNAKWQGIDPVKPDDGSFVRFKDPTWGIRALARVLIAYQDKHDINTVRGIISRWAPPGDNNDTPAYVAHVCALMRVGPNDEIDVHDYDYAHPLVKAIITHENGQQPYTDAQIDKGLVLAGIQSENAADLGKSGTIKGSVVATVGTAGAASLPTLIDGARSLAESASTVSESVAPILPWLEPVKHWGPVIMTTVALVAIGYIIWRRIDDRRRGLR